jgi:hypothetical protein
MTFSSSLMGRTRWRWISSMGRRSRTSAGGGVGLDSSGISILPEIWWSRWARPEARADPNCGIFWNICSKALLENLSAVTGVFAVTEAVRGSSRSRLTSPTLEGSGISPISTSPPSLVTVTAARPSITT